MKRPSSPKKIGGSGGDEPPVLSTLDRKVILAMADVGDLDVALRLGADHVENVFNVEYGDALAQVLLKLDPAEDRVKRAMRVLRDLEAELDAQPIQIHAPQENGGINGSAEPHKDVPLSKFQLRDKINGALGLFGTVGIACATYFGVRATFAVSGLDIFHEAPELLNTLPILPLALSVAIKMAGGAFTLQATRDAYRRVVMFTGIGAGLLWLPLFSVQYDGLSGSFDPYAEPSHLLSVLFNATHLLAETLISAGIFTATDALLAKYSDSHKIDNPVRKPLLDARAPASEALDEALDALANLTGQRDELMGIKGAGHNLVETAIRQKFNERPRDSLL
ncbi:hypothetical protein [Ascidiaceihabitans sp.]|uniref:hypothetical protein n=1 Tax=Ascidiaceihabitans sp. TaxID=1872644 RepID=UPI0032982B6E